MWLEEREARKKVHEIMAVLPEWLARGRVVLQALGYCFDVLDGVVVEVKAVDCFALPEIVLD